jgi:hypothetical protein
MEKRQKTLADYLVIAISPTVIMLLVGSLAFFLIQVFYRGETVYGARWLMFWFVLAIVLVSRVGIEQGKGHARVYGAALAIATWFYLAYTLRTPVFGAILLAVIWWCAHQLTVDCTLISEDEDASGEGVLQGLWRNLEKSLVPPEPELKPPPLSPLDRLVAADLARRRAKNSPRSPGRSVVYFSLAALPLFGIGQLFLPTDDPHARRTGFVFLALYLGAALSLLVTTSFLGLRRYLRQRSVEMPASVTLGWIKFGVLLVGGVLLLALILPRPGANNTWKTLTYRIEHKEHKASDYALPFNPPGEGEGTPTDQPIERNRPGIDSRKAPAGGGSQSTRNDNRNPSNSRNQSDRPASDGNGSGAGNQGSDGQGNPSGDGSRSDDNNRTSEKKTIRLKDVVPNSGADQPNEKEQPAGGGGTGEPNGNGPGGQVISDNQSQGSNKGAKESQRNEQKQQKPTIADNKAPEQPEPQQPENTSQTPKPPSQLLSKLLRVLVILALAALFIWLLVRYRKVIAEMIRTFIAAVREFFRKFFNFRRRKSAPEAEESPSPAPTLEPFAAYENPFVTGKDKTWPPERLLFYTYEAVQAWAKEQGIEMKPQQTPREFCRELIERFPDFGPELEQFSFYYGHAAFAKRLPDDFETESLRRLWQYLGDSIMVVASR